MEQLLIKTIIVVCNLTSVQEFDNSQSKKDCFNFVMNCSTKNLDYTKEEIDNCAEAYNASRRR